LLLVPSDAEPMVTLLEQLAAKVLLSIAPGPRPALEPIPEAAS